MKLLEDVTHTSARFSDCGAYRYDLVRAWGPEPKVLWIMLNPSTAAADVDDPTVRRTQTFARAWGYGGVVVCNLFALRSTDPRALYAHPDPEGPENDRTLTRWATSVLIGRTVVAWGVHGALDDRGARVAQLLANVGVDQWCLGTTKAGHPRHPLYVKGGTILRPFTIHES